MWHHAKHHHAEDLFPISEIKESCEHSASIKGTRCMFSYQI